MARDKLRRAVQYVRMSTEHQRYSITYQTAANATYALDHGYEMVGSYDDAGISGLSLKRRHGLQRLLADVVSGETDFGTVLVYDVSRWGRFQDTDESAHYEFLCRSAGVQVIYTAEPFANDGSLASSLVKHLKRAMAAEFSRELSARVSRTQRGLGGEGYWMGGHSLFGLGRRIAGPNRQDRGGLQPGERKAVRGDRTILAPGPPQEVAIVRRMFRMFVRQKVSVRTIARQLNAEGRHPPGRAWTSVRVRSILKNEAYAGTMVIGKSRYVLGAFEKKGRSEWIRAPGAFEPVIGRRLFAAAQARFRVARQWASDVELLDELRAALAVHGRLSADIIDADRTCHCTEIYRRRFGSLLAAYQAIGYELEPWHAAMCANALKRPAPAASGHAKYPSDTEMLEGVRRLLETRGRLSRSLIEDTPGLPHLATLKRRFGGLAGLYACVGYAPSPIQAGRMSKGPEYGPSPAGAGVGTP